MVTMKRRTRTRVDHTLDSIGFSVPYGDGDDHDAVDGVESPTNRNTTRHHNSNNSKNNNWTPGTRFSFDYYKATKQSNSWLLRIVYSLAAISWMYAYKDTYQTRILKDNLETQQMALKIQGEETYATLQDAREGLKNVRAYVANLKQTQDALYHEIRMVNEMFEAESSGEMPESPREGSSDSLVQSWMQHRQTALKNKIKNLKEYIQQESYMYVMEE